MGISRGLVRLFFYSFVGLMVFPSLPARFVLACESSVEALSSSEQPDILREIVERRGESPLTPRGYLGSEVPINAETKSFFARAGIKNWGLKIFVLPSLEAAKAHHDSIPDDPLMKGLYIIADLDVSTLSEEKWGSAFEQVSQNGLIWFEGGEVHEFTEEQINRIDTTSMQIIELPGFGHLFYPQGWFFLPKRGLIHLDEWESSKSIKRIRRDKRKLEEQGYRFVFNHKFEESIDRVNSQVRTSGEPSRYLEPEVRETLHQEYRNGVVFNLVLLSPEGEMLAGTIGYQHGNLFEGDTVFYSDINQAKMVVVHLGDLLAANNIPIIDAAMVSPFTAGLKGKYYPSSHFLEVMESLPAEAIKLPE